MDTPNLFPHPDGMSSFWRSSPGNLDNHRSTETLPTTIDSLIIGAGYSAASLITHLLQETNETQTKPDILVLEARQLCSGATGRNGGHLKADPYRRIAELESQYGLAAAAELAEFEAANVRAVKGLVEQEKIDCDLILTRAFDVNFSSDRAKRVQAGYERLLRSRVKPTTEVFPIPPKYAERVSSVKGAVSAYSYTAGHLWPYKLVHHLFNNAIKQGVNLQTHTKVLDVGSTPDRDGYWTITTSRGVVRSKKVILTTNAYTPALLPEYRDKIIPYRAFCSRIVTPGPAPLLTNTYSLVFSDWDFDYLIPRLDGSIIVGGARQAYLHEQGEWYNNTDDSKMHAGAKKYFDGYMQRHFHGWEESGAYADQVWTGIMGYSSDRLPRIGPIPGRPGMYVMAGFTGHGMPQIFLSAKGMAKIVLDGVPFAETGIPRLFEETKARLEGRENKVMGLYNAIPRTKL